MTLLTTQYCSPDPFPNNNKEIALKTVLKSVNLKYTTQENSIILED